MDLLLSIFWIILCLVLSVKLKKSNRTVLNKEAEILSLTQDLQNSRSELVEIKDKYACITDAKLEADSIIARANQIESNAQRISKLIISNSENDANLIKHNANEYSKSQKIAADEIKNLAKLTAVEIKEKANERLNAIEKKLEKANIQATTLIEEANIQASTLIADANSHATLIIANAKTQAENIAGDTYRALQEGDKLKASIEAMQNIIDGYGYKYVQPSHSILDDLAQAYSYTEAGQELKKARELSKQLIDVNLAASCEYVQKNRSDIAIKFVLDAFNGKVDSILSRAKIENHGTLSQEIQDAAAIVNYNGSAFRNAQISKSYINARINELLWTVRVNKIREQEKEEQKAIKEKIREEERARKEYERALKEADREEELVRKALEKAHTLLAKANNEQREKYELQIQQLNDKLLAAEEKNKRALSMAQQTKTGHVYVISNIGSFGEHVYKIGMTRRLEPLDRVRELGDASVPFSFDVHAMIWSENAPALEKSIHRKFIQSQLNKVNPRKEFFKLTIAEIRQELDSMGIEVSWTMAADAREFRETQAIEQKIKTDEIARGEWLRQQIVYEDKIEESESIA